MRRQRPFRLHADFSPQGDQPRAIRELVAGVGAGLRHQVLLGVTGSGKSLPPEEPVWVYRPRGGRLARVEVPIGELVEQEAARAGLPRALGAETEAFAPAGPLFAPSFDPAAGRVCLRAVRQLVRHAAPRSLRRVVGECGREVRVTADHNFVVRRGGRLQTLATDELGRGDEVPCPEGAAEETLPLELPVRPTAVAVDLGLSWSRVAAVEEVPAGAERVYDLSVAETETFLAGRRGGLFVHNTFTMASVVAAVNRPTLVIAPNKTLAAQLYNEFRRLFPENAVRYFVSYYDYYQPEAYVPQTDTYIEKDASINDEIDKMRHAATKALLERTDTLIVASVSCIYGLGSPTTYFDMLLYLERGATVEREAILRKLVDIQYQRTDFDFHRGTFRVRGDVVEIFPAYEEGRAVRVELFGDEVEALTEIDPLRGTVIRRLDSVAIYPASHYVAGRDKLERAVESIRAELAERLAELRAQRKLLEAQRLEQRTLYDLELLTEMGFCPGIENYSRHLDGRRPGEPPFTLLDYFPEDYLMFIDESHITVPQIGGMYRGDRSRKETLVEYGFRLPSALDNRPLDFSEFMARVNQVIYVSATPGDFELEQAGGRVVEQLIRPTGLTDPEVIVRPARYQVDDLLEEVRQRTERRERVLVTTLTKKMAEDLTDYLQEVGVRVRYIHSDIDTIERVAIIRDLRRGVFDVLVGINLLREGLDLPEVSLVAILDADKEGYLRSERSLIQTMGRAARNVRGTVIMYADHVTTSMRRALDETNRRRAVQEAYNRTHGITPQSIQKAIGDPLVAACEADYVTVPAAEEEEIEYLDPRRVAREVEKLRAQMRAAAAALEFERAAELRDRIRALEARALGVEGAAVEQGQGPE